MVCTVPDCGGEHVAQGLCERHYRRWRRYGDPEGSAPVATAAERLAARSAFNVNGCREWTGPPNRDGYGLISFGGQRWLAHRLAWTIEHGPIPDGLQVRHVVCDNPACLTVKHMDVGTAQDNHDDMNEHGRRPWGSRAASAKLTDQEVDDVRSRYAAGGVSQYALAAEYGVAVMSINRIVNRKSYVWR
jgi:hypothetical protein